MLFSTKSIESHWANQDQNTWNDFTETEFRPEQILTSSSEYYRDLLQDDVTHGDGEIQQINIQTETVYK